MTAPLLEHLSDILQSVQLIKTVFVHFVFLIAIQLVAALRCLYLIFNKGAQRDIKAFLNDYWRWSHLRQNSLILSLWLSSFAAYLSVWLVSAKLADISIVDAYTKVPIQTLCILLGLIALLIYTVQRSLEQIAATHRSISHLKKMRIYSAFKSTLKRIQGAPINTTSWGGWIGTVATATEWLSEHLVKRKIDAEMKNALINFSVYATFEYFVRMLIVATAVWVAYY